ncbi:VTT domain-containing protein [Candidatus Pacebacteria bacterium]|nr:VTT domain-containing protein [Candidatus Paceibacterota bacterium]
MQEKVPTRESESTDLATQKGVAWLRSKYAVWILGGTAFAESMFAPILIDPFLVALIIAKRELWKRYIFISVAASVVGGIAGYGLGILFFDTVGIKLITFFGLGESFASISENFDSNGFVFVLIGAFTPIPYKIVALASGVLHINIVTFLVASIFGRLFRLGLVGFAAYAVGPRALPVMQKHLHLIAAIIGMILVAYIIFQFI